MMQSADLEKLLDSTSTTITAYNFLLHLHLQSFKTKEL